LIRFLGEVFAGLGRNFSADGKDSDIRDIDAVYLARRGAFFVVEDAGRIVGSVGVRKLTDEIAELKRVYLEPEFRGAGLGEALCIAAIAEARKLGYKALRLDSTRDSVRALGLFRKLGFREIERYHDHLFAEIFMELEL